LPALRHGPGVRLNQRRRIHRLINSGTVLASIPQEKEGEQPHSLWLGWLLCTPGNHSAAGVRPTRWGRTPGFSSDGKATMRRKASASLQVWDGESQGDDLTEGTIAYASAQGEDEQSRTFATIYGE